MINITWTDVYHHALAAASRAAARMKGRAVALYGVPTGGFFAAQAVESFLTAAGKTAHLVESLQDLPLLPLYIVDDIIDSGKTRLKTLAQVQVDRPCTFVALIDKKGCDKGVIDEKDWYSFPWERMKKDTGVEDNITRILQFIGEDPKRPGLVETPKRVAKSYEELFAGYKQKPENVIKCFDDVSYDEMVICKDIEFYSTCEHHLQPFFGKAHIGYIPDGKVIGLSKLARVLDIYARRLQIQERLCDEVTTALMDHLKPKGAACIIEAKHFCMICRGVQKQHSSMVTSSLKGVFRDLAVREEFLNLIRR